MSQYRKTLLDDPYEAPPIVDEVLRHAVVFRADWGGENRLLHPRQLPRLPFQNVLVEWGRDLGFAIAEVSKSTIDQVSQDPSLTAFAWSGGVDFAWFVSMGLRNNRGFRFSEPMLVTWEPAGLALRYAGQREVPPREKSLEVFSHTAMWCIEFFTLLTCRNVSAQVVYPPAALSRRNRERHGRPLVAYRELVIDLSKTPGYRHQAPEGGSTQPLRLHLVRGHMRDYTRTGLFGKEELKGRYWCPPMTRGSVKSGVVVKSYAVKK